MKLALLREKLGDLMTDADEFRGELTIYVDKKDILPVCRILKDQLFFNYLSDLCGVDYWPQTPRFCVVYHLYSFPRNHRLRVKVFLNEECADVDSVTAIWAAADWHERECFDLLGIRFANHPDLRRILLPDDFSGHPLRKDYPLEGKQ